MRATRHRVHPVIRALLLQRARNRCEACGQRVATAGWDAHHRKQRSVGGHDELYNLVAVCRACHNRIHAYLQAAKSHGWVVDSWQNPLDVPVDMHDGRVYLDGLGDLTVLDP